MLETLTDAVIWVGAAGAIQGCNVAFERLIQQPADRILGAQLSHILPLMQEEISIASSDYPDVRIRSGSYQTAEYWIRNPDTRILEISGCCVADETGSIAILLIRDVTQAQVLKAEYRQKETALQQAEAKYRSIFENATQGIFQTSPEGYCISANPALAKITGYDSPSDLTSNLTNIEEQVYVEPERRREFLRLLHEQGAVSKLESQIYRKDHSIIWISESARVICDESGQLLYYEGFVEDITERKQAELEQQKVLSVLQATLEATADAILVVDRRRNAPVYNQKFVQMWGVSEELMQPGREDDRIQFLASKTIDPQAFLARVWDLFLNHPEEVALELLEFKDGRVFERYSQPLWDDQQIMGRVWSFRDVTEQKQAETALKASEAELRTLFEAMDDVILVFDRAGCCIKVAPTKTDKFFETPEVILGKRVHDILPRDTADLQLHCIQQALATKATQSVEYSLALATGEYWFSANVAPLSEETVIWVARDITGRKQAEAALRRSELKYRHLYENSQVGIFRTRAEDGLILDANPCSLQMIGFSDAQEVIGKRSILDFYVNWSDREWVLQQVRLYGACNHYEVQFRRSDGQLRWGLCSVQLNREEKCLDAVITDISDRKRLEEELLQSQRFLDNVIDNIPLAIFAKDAATDFRYVLINRNSEKILGFPREGAIGLRDEDLIGKEQAFFHHQEDLAAIAQQDVLEIPEQWIRTTLNENILVRGWKVPLYDTLGNVTHILAISEDVTERKHREQALRLIVEGTAAKTGDEFFQSCVRYLAEVLRVRYALVTEFADSSKTRVRTLATYFSAQSNRSRTNWESFEAGGQGDLFEYDLHGTPCEKVLQGQICYYPGELQTLFPEDTPAIEAGLNSYLGIPLADSSGTILGHLAVMDTNPMKPDSGRELILKIFAARAGAELERKRAEAAQRIAKEAAEAANRAKSTFLANMSHELRTPLNAILGFAQLMERDRSLTSNQQASLRIINRSGEHLLELINDVLEMSKIEAGRITLNPAPFDLHQLLSALHEMFLIRATSKQLTLQFDLAPDLPQYVLTDEGKLRQVLMNLLSNAVKFTQQGTVTLQVRKQNIDSSKIRDSKQEQSSEAQSSLIFEVADTGQGIAPEEIGMLFQPFVQTASSSQAKEGTGLGLAISRQFVHLMGGEIEVSSQVGQGAAFWFYIPLISSDMAQMSPALPKGKVLHLAPGQPAYRILVVDDRPENRDLITQLLNTVGLQTYTANNGQEAIEQWQRWQPHLIWMDMRMPVTDGYEATRRIRAAERAARIESQGLGAKDQTPHLQHPCKIIALTASAFEEQQASILAAGCDDLVCKPFRESTIFEKMTAHLGIEFLYAESAEPDRSFTSAADASATDLILHPSSLVSLPTEWIAALHHAALAVDGDRILQLIEQLPITHQALAQGLTELVHRFEFDAILELAQEGTAE